LHPVLHCHSEMIMKQVVGKTSRTTVKNSLLIFLESSEIKKNRQISLPVFSK
jgi:hypothetical protein